jgi:Domain of unknown function (DUF1963)
MATWDEKLVKALLSGLRGCCALFWREQVQPGKVTAAKVAQAVDDLCSGLGGLDIDAIERDFDTDLQTAMKLWGAPVHFAGFEADSYAGAAILLALNLQAEMQLTCQAESYLEGSKAAAHWGALFSKLRPEIMTHEQFEELTARIDQEYRERPPEKRYHKVYRARRPLPSAKAKRVLARYRLPAKPEKGEAFIDVLQFVAGESVDRHVTKIGGLPYRPARLAWPVAGNGTHLTFVAQFCFADSRDLVGALPGDVLLIFGTENLIYDTVENLAARGELLFEWYPLGLDQLVEADQIPPVGWPIAPCYGFLRRQPEPAGGHEGTRIGGERPFWAQRDQRINGRFLGALARPKMLKATLLPAGWEQTRAATGYDRVNEFAPGDGGIINFFHAGNGKVSFGFDCH